MTLLISGTFPGPVFPEWIAHRAKLLELVGWVKRRSNQLLEVQLTGHQVLIEALETACSLGPMEVDVESIQIQLSTKPTPFTDFQILN